MNSLMTYYTRVVVIFAILSGACKGRQASDDIVAYSVDIWDTHGSLAYNMYYHIDNDSLSLTLVDGLEDGRDSLLLQHKLTVAERARFGDYLSALSIDTFRSDYINPFVEDGDQKRVILRVGGKEKIIDISNVYLERMDGLFKVINSVTRDKRYKIRYSKRW